MNAHSAPKEGNSKDMARRRTTRKTSKGVNLGFEEKLWAAADTLRGHMDAAEYKHIVLGIVFLKYISDAFNELHSKLEADELSNPEAVEEDGEPFSTLPNLLRAAAKISPIPIVQAALARIPEFPSP